MQGGDDDVDWIFFVNRVGREKERNLSENVQGYYSHLIFSVNRIRVALHSKTTKRQSDH